jgi:hypothetical protein
MKIKILYNTLKEASSKTIVLLMFFFLFGQFSNAQNASLRRPVSQNSPMWLIHIDTWNYADPQKIIDLIPQDIRPYVVMNISLSISHDVATSQFKVAEYGYETAKSWLRICAENRMWTMVQPASGGLSQFSDFDLSVYEEFYRDYPNFIGFNYAEQFWGFDDPNDPISAAWADRMSHFVNLLKLSNKYGGYLSVSWCGGGSINPIGMLKRNPDFAAACRNYTENYILAEKYTTQSYIFDRESLCLGAYLSGYSGNYGIRYDDSGWTDMNKEHKNFTMATAGAPHLEHAMLTGQTVIDGPELIWANCFRETNRITSTNGYTSRNWETYPQFDNVNIDLFRKILDGTVRIPSRSEVIDRTKVAIINNVNTGTDDDKYSSPQTIFDGLYAPNGENYQNNKTFFKTSGRYPTIPTVFQLDDAQAQSFQIQVNKSDYNTRWSTISNKITELNTLFPEEYTGDLYAGRHENGWVVYNPFLTGQTASANIPFKYNTCSAMDLTFSQYTSGVVKETSNQLKFYLNNYDNVLDTNLKIDIIKIYGSNSEPTFSYQDRGSHQASEITTTWSGGIFTLTIKHNGALDITVNCSGSATGRLTNYTNATLIEPQKPAIYAGPRQYEAEHFDFKNINKVVTSGSSEPVRNYTGQGYIVFGINSTASVRDEIHALRKGTYQLRIRYTAPDVTVANVDLFINGIKVATPTFTKTTDANTWNVNTQNITLNSGNNEIRLEANATGSGNIYFDNIVFTQSADNNVYNFTEDIAKTVASIPAAELITIQSGSAGVVSYTDANNFTSNAFKAYSTGLTNGTAVADLDMFETNATDYSITWKEYYTTVGGKKGVLLRATGANGSCSYADGMKQGYLFIVLNNADGTVTLKPYVAGQSSITAKPSYSTSSLKIMLGQPAWYRASAIGDKLIFECSADGINWEGAQATTFQDATYTSGASELVWGLNSNNFDWVMDDIKFSNANLSISKFNLEGFVYDLGSGPSNSQTFSVSGSSLLGNILVKTPDNYELSLSPTASYSSQIALTQNNGVVSNTTVYVRMKSGLSIGDKTGEITITSGVMEQQINLDGKVNPLPVFVKYDFTKDVATTSANTPPAIYATIGQGNTSTAGVISYTDLNNVTSNVIKPYGGGQKSSTGVIDLNAFSKTATDYSVTWKQYIGSESTAYKVGILLRGNTEQVGSASSGYVQGILEGYLFLSFNTGSDNKTKFRIYRSNSTGLSFLTDVESSFDPSPNQPVWYRASVSGTGTVSLKMEYSIDGVNWITGASITDTGSTYNSGATQIVWGLAVNTLDFYIDDISFAGLDNPGALVTDDDTDGVPNDLDTCPNTPSGQTVNIYGCTAGQLDDDTDGVINSLDTCPNSPSGQIVNTTGCAGSQLDDDGDGVSNNLDLCPDTPTGQTVDVNGCLIIGANNFAIEVSGETCPGKNNGQIKITATQNLTYSATVDGVNKIFTDKTLLLTDLTPNTYDVCINIAEGNIKQCYSIVVPESAAITAKTTSASDKLEVGIQSGTAPYQVSVNGVLQFETTSSNFTVDVNNGDVLEVTTSKVCEGTFAKTITLYDLVKAFPNPTVGPFDVYLPTKDTSAAIEIYTVGGTLISKAVYPIENGKAHIDLQGQPTGIYIVKVQSNPVQAVRIIKK